MGMGTIFQSKTRSYFQRLNLLYVVWHPATCRMVARWLVSIIAVRIALDVLG